MLALCLKSMLGLYVRFFLGGSFTRCPNRMGNAPKTNKSGEGDAINRTTTQSQFLIVKQCQSQALRPPPPPPPPSSSSSPPPLSNNHDRSSQCASQSILLLSSRRASRSGCPATGPIHPSKILRSGNFEMS